MTQAIDKPLSRVTKRQELVTTTNVEWLMKEA